MTASPEATAPIMEDTTGCQIVATNKSDTVAPWPTRTICCAELDGLRRHVQIPSYLRQRPKLVISELLGSSYHVPFRASASMHEVLYCGCCGCVCNRQIVIAAASIARHQAFNTGNKSNTIHKMSLKARNMVLRGGCMELEYIQGLFSKHLILWIYVMF